MALYVRQKLSSHLKKFHARTVVMLPDEPYIAERGIIHSTIELKGKYLLQFPGLNSHWQGMCRDLLNLAPSVTKPLAEEASEILGRDIIHLINDGSPLDISQNSASLIVFHSYLAWCLICHETGFSLSDVGAVCGVGLGEISALMVAESLSFGDGLRFVHKRNSICEAHAEFQRQHGKDSVMVELVGVYPYEAEGAKGISVPMSPGHTGVLMNNWGGYSTERSANDDYFICDVAAVMDYKTIVLSGFSKNVSQIIANLQVDPTVDKFTVNYYDARAAFHSSALAGCAKEINDELNRTPFYDPKVPICLNSYPVPTTDIERIVTSVRRQTIQGYEWIEVLRGLWHNELPGAEYWEIGPSQNNYLSKLTLQSLNRRISTRTFSDAEQIRLFWKQKRRKLEKLKRRPPLSRGARTISLREPALAVSES